MITPTLWDQLKLLTGFCERHGFTVLTTEMSIVSYTLVFKAFVHDPTSETSYQIRFHPEKDLLEFPVEVGTDLCAVITRLVGTSPTRTGKWYVWDNVTLDILRK